MGSRTSSRDVRDRFFGENFPDFLFFFACVADRLIDIYLTFGEVGMGGGFYTVLYLYSYVD